jgi:uncharacterized membrane protein YqhA
MRPLELLFQRILWNSRLLVLIAVVASLIGAVAMFVVAGKDALDVIGLVKSYVTGSDEGHALRGRIVTRIAEFIDGLLFASVQLIFALGLYELFVGKIEGAERSELAQRLLLIESIDELKERLAKVIFLILIVRYFEYAFEIPITTASELLSLALGIALIALGLFLTKPKSLFEAKRMFENEKRPRPKPEPLVAALAVESEELH